MMNRVLVCIGATAQKPFYFEKVYTNLYSIEELCFVLHENAFILEDDIMTKDLVKWIDTECKLPELADDLYPMINHNAGVSAFVGRILEYVGYYPADEIEKTETILKNNISLSVFERWKAKGDYLCENGHYILAIMEYDNIITKMDEQDPGLKSRVYNNMGVAYMALKLYSFAEEQFMNAYRIDGNEDALRHYLASSKLHLSSDDFFGMVTDMEINSEIVTSVLNNISDLANEFEDSSEANNLQCLFYKKNSQDAQAYYDKITEITDELKAGYRESVKDTVWRAN